MEYNKDEAQRAFEIAEAKIVAQELAAAKKFAGKAQQLYPSLEGLSQMNAVLGVYMAAENKINGQTDWYGILQVDLAADEAHIKKQYRKLALLLHPDKNKCAGAEGAFKLIGEAWGVLSDRAKRTLYDHKRSTVTTQNFKIQKAPNNGYGVAKQNETFWTACPTCKMQYEYPRMYINHNLLCPNCAKPYMAFEIPGFHKNGVRPSAGFRAGTGAGGYSGMPAGAPYPTANVGVANAKSAAAQNNQRTSAAPRASNGASKAKNGNNLPKRKEEAAPPSRNSNAKEKKSRRKKPRTEECDSDEVIHADEVSLSEDEDDDDQDDCEDVTEEISKPNKKKRDQSNRKDTSSKSRKRADQKDIGTNADADGNADEDGDGDGDSEEDKPSNIDVPDPDFHNFDDERTPACFQEGQVWAVYDDLDGMPRFYALIQKVISSSSEENFKVKMNWLEASVKDNKAVRKWLKAGVYQGCGNFKVGKAHRNETPLNTFSHAVAWEKDPNGIIRIIPRKGEVWALYKEWDFSWNESTPEEIIRKYEMVEISIEYDEEAGVGVASLVKADGFKSLFQRTDVARLIPKSEFLRFSHQVPAKKLSGNEALNLPENCWELDPAAMPVSR